MRESLASEGVGCKWWMSHLNEALQSLHHVLAEKSQENKWLSFKLQQQDRGDRQCECHSPHSIDFMLKNSVPREEKAHKHRNPGKFELSVMKPNKFLLLISKENSLPIIQKCNKMPKKKKKNESLFHHSYSFGFFFKFSILTFNRNEFQA